VKPGIDMGQWVVYVERNWRIGIVLIIIIPLGCIGDMRQILHGGVRRHITGQVNEGIVVDGDVPPMTDRQQYDPQSQCEEAYGPQQTPSLLSGNLWLVGQLIVKRLWVIRSGR
jgi:hypothetical protein